MHKNQKGFAHLFIVIVIVIIGIGGLLYLSWQRALIKTDYPQEEQFNKTTPPSRQPSSDNSPTGWKSYTDDLEKYTFSYPADWRISKGNPNQLYNYRSEESSNGDFDPQQDKDKIKIEIYTYTDMNIILDDFVKKEDKESSDLRGYKVKRQYEEIGIDNQRALKTITDSYLSSDAIILLVYVQNPLTKRVHTFVAMPRYDVNKEIIDQILSTFQFLY